MGETRSARSGEGVREIFGAIFTGFDFTLALLCTANVNVAMIDGRATVIIAWLLRCTRCDVFDSGEREKERKKEEKRERFADEIISAIRFLSPPPPPLSLR